MFSITSDQIKQINEWKNSHKCSLRNAETGKMETGAIGGALTYMFTPTSIGDSVEVECGCGEKINVTDYSTW